MFYPFVGLVEVIHKVLNGVFSEVALANFEWSAIWI